MQSIETKPIYDVNPRSYKYFTFIAMFFVTVQLASNLTAQKLTTIDGFTFTAANLLFPISYIFGDIVTEVYGYSQSRRLIWSAFACNILFAIMLYITVWAPPATMWHQQSAFEGIFNAMPRMVLASLIAGWCGEFCNAYVLSKLKIFSQGKRLWIRTISSSATGVLVDSIVFIIIAFAGSQTWSLIFSAGFTEYIMKISYEIIATPITYLLVYWLKRSEGVDAYDTKTNFNPFAWK